MSVRHAAWSARDDVAISLFDLKYPTEPSKWLTLIWVFTLGVISCKQGPA